MPNASDQDLEDPVNHASYSSDNWADDSGDEFPRNRSTSFSRIRQAGGVNSIDNFARSWQRAAHFPEALLRRSSYVAAADSDDDEWTTTAEGVSGSPSNRQSERSPLLAGDNEVGPSYNDFGGQSPPRRGLPSTGLLGSSMDNRYQYGTSCSTISSRVSDAARRHAIQLHREQQLALPEVTDVHHNNEESLLVKRIQDEEGKRQNVVVGRSTVPQTTFNSVNVLIGVGLLSLPLAMKQAGWFLGLLFLLFSAVTTSYTAKILAKCLDVDSTLVTYADLAYISFGHHARLITSFLFCLELVGACVALVVLFADSLHALIPLLSILQWKVVCGVILIPLNFVPLRYLSVTSILGILSCTSIVLIIFVDGLLKPHSPGSIWQPARTTFFPDDWRTLPLSLGLIMSPWGGHSVFPNIYKDMRHPHRYGESLWTTYIFTYSLDCAMAIIGWVMFGDAVRDEVTANILLLTDEYPRILTICMIVFISIIPITKVPLNCRPLVATLEVLCGLQTRPEASANHTRDVEGVIRQSSKIMIRVLTVVVIVTMAVVFPSFDRIMALMGSCLCFTICIILPIAFYLRIFGKEISPRERALDWFLLVVSSILAAVGSVWAFLPSDAISK